jgi:hypothetical protein
MTLTPPGWYPDPQTSDTAQRRYWDGTHWTTQVSLVQSQRAGTSGKELLRSSWGALRQDKQLLLLPVIAAVSTTLALGLFIGLGWMVGLDTRVIDSVSGSHHYYSSPLAWICVAVLTYVTTAIAVYFQVALAAGATQRLDGGDPTLSSCFAVANRRLPQILTWALIATTVGLILRLVLERLGVAGQLMIWLGGLAWAVLTFFVVPVILVEGNGSLSAVTRSKDLMLATWGKVARSGLRFGLIFLPAVWGSVAAIAVGIGLVASSAPILGALICAVGAIGFIAVALLANAVGTYLRLVLYRYATGQPVPGISTQLLASAVGTTR